MAQIAEDSKHRPADDADYTEGYGSVSGSLLVTLALDRMNRR